MARKPSKGRKASGRKALGPLADVALPPEMGMSGMPGGPGGGILLSDPSVPLPDPLAGASDGPPVDVELPSDDGLTPVMTDAGALETMLPDGGVEIDFDPRDEVPEVEFGGNLADVLDDLELSRIAEDLMEGIEADDQSRAQWLADRAKGIELLGLRIDDPRTGVQAPVQGMSVIRHPLLLDAVLRFQANARSELLPAHGPVKVTNDGIETQQTDKDADVLEDMLNHYLTQTATEYYPDTNRMLFEVGFSGCAFKKVYRCPIKRRPVSISIMSKDLIVSDAATDLESASRITHRSDMSKALMKRMQWLGVYRDVELGEPTTTNTDPVKEAIDSVQGIQTGQRPEDQQYEILECYCELDIAGFEHTDDGKPVREGGVPTGLPLPYRVTLERSSRKILEIRRNWKEGDPDYRRQLNIVKFSFADGFGFYSMGLLHILGNATAAATASWRMLLDAGSFANFPGLMIAKQMGRQRDNNFRVGPGEAVQIDTGSLPIQQTVMPLPYKEPSQALMLLHENIVQTGAKAAGSADVPVGEGKQDAPVGTTLALLEGQMKVMSAVHKNLHTSQKREFELFTEEFKTDPEAVLKGNRRAAKYFDVTSFLSALENYALVPHSDPNVPSAMHRMAKMQAMFQIAQAAPMLFNLVEVAREMLQEIGFSDPDRFFAPPQPPQPDPMMEIAKAQAQNEQAKTMLKARELTMKEQKALADVQIAMDRNETEKAKAVLSLAGEMAKNPASDAVVDQQLIQLSPFLSNPMALAQMRSIQFPRIGKSRRSSPRPNRMASPQLPGLGLS